MPKDYTETPYRQTPCNTIIFMSQNKFLLLQQKVHIK